MIEFFRKLFGQPGSSSTAKERLRLVLMSDHLTLAPEMIDKLKSDLVDVISKYVEVDRDKIEVNFEEHDKALAMLANIPILSVNRPTGGDGGDGGSGGEKHEEPVAAAASEALPKKRRRKKRTTSPNGAIGAEPARAT